MPHSLASSTPVTFDSEQRCFRVTGYHLGRATLRHPSLSSRLPEAALIEQDQDDPLSLILLQALFQDGQVHHAHRAALEAPLRRQSASMREAIESTIRYLLGRIGQAPWEVERDLAAPLTLLTLGHLLGMAVPFGAELLTLTRAQYHRVEAQLLRWQEGLTAIADLTTGYPSVAAIIQAERFHRVIGHLLSQKRRHPQADVATIVATDSRFRSGRERVSTTEMVLGAGTGTTTTLLTNGLVLLLKEEGWFQQFRARLLATPHLEGRLLRQLAEELLRRVTPTQAVARWAREDLSLGGVAIPKGSKVVVALAAMNHDPTVFPDPEQLNPERVRVGQHLAFGAGPHACPGRGLALLEIHAALTGLMRLPDLHLVPDQPLKLNSNANQKRYLRVLVQ